MTIPKKRLLSSVFRFKQFIADQPGAALIKKRGRGRFSARAIAAEGGQACDILEVPTQLAVAAVFARKAAPVLDSRELVGPRSPFLQNAI